MARVDGKVAVVTGSGNGIGRAIALALAAAGAKVAVADVLADDGARTAGEITDAGGAAIFVQTDVSVPEQAATLIERAADELGAPDILVNNAGIGGGRELLHEMDLEDFDRVYQVNLRGTFLMSKFAIPHFLAKKDGRIVNIASTYGLIGAPRSAPYCATKGAIINLTRQMAVDYSPYGIRTNAICPGYIDTGLGRRGPTMSPQEYAAANSVREKAAGLQPIGRQGMPSEIGEVALFLASDSSSFMTGATVAVDGGCTTTFNYGEAAN